MQYPVADARLGKAQLAGARGVRAAGDALSRHTDILQGLTTASCDLRRCTVQRNKSKATQEQKIPSIRVLSEAKSRRKRGPAPCDGHESSNRVGYPLHHPEVVQNRRMQVVAVAAVSMSPKASPASRRPHPWQMCAKSRLMCISDVHKPSSAALRASVPQRFRGRMIRYRDADGGTRILRNVQAVLLQRAADVSRNLHMPHKQLSSRTSAVGFRYPMATGQFKSRRYSEPPSSCVRHELHSLHRSARTPRAVRPGEMALSAATRIQCVRL